jgi:uncharacterized surface protein with fasciclin (FAS1) repeats
MKLINKIKNIVAPVLVAGVLFASCNKTPDAPVPNNVPGSGTAPTLATVLNDPNYSFFKAAATKAGVITNPLAVNTLRFTLYLPDDAAFIASGIPSVAVINNNAILDTPTVKAIVQYHISPQVITAAAIPTTFPNFYYPSIFNPFPSVSALLRLDNYPSARANGAWLNNIPIIQTDIPAVNGVIHRVARVVQPPNAFLWSRIAVDPDMTYLRAAILRADSGTTQTPGTLNPANLQSVLSNFGPNLTVFAPTDTAFKVTLTGAIYLGLVAQGSPPGAGTLATANTIATATDANGPTVFRNPLLYSVLTAQTVKGIVVYHLLGDRAFSVNLPSTTTSVKTLLNSAIPTHPGIGITATFTGPSVTAATVKGVGNATAFPISINPTPNPAGTSDQHFINGVLHKLNGVLLPQ